MYSVGHLLVERVNNNNRTMIKGGWSTALLTGLQQVIAQELQYRTNTYMFKVSIS